MTGVLPVAAPTDLSGFPVRLFAKHLQQIFTIKKARFYALKKAGRFDRFLLKPEIGRPAWSKTKVQQYLDGEASSSSWAPRVVGRSR